MNLIAHEQKMKLFNDNKGQNFGSKWKSNFQELIMKKNTNSRPL